MRPHGKIHALCATARIANLPSVISNVWVGAMIHGCFVNPFLDGRSMTCVMAAGMCLYLAGNFLNDWMDRAWDSRNRPERALPRGLFTPGTYLGVAVILSAGGITAAFTAQRLAGATALGILSFIVIYTVWHKRSPWMVIPMGLCRGLLPVMGALGMMRWPSAPGSLQTSATMAALAGGALFFYIAGLSLSARSEANPTAGRSPRVLSLWCFSISALLVFPHFLSIEKPGWWCLSPLPFLGWWALCQTRYRKTVSSYVSALLAGIPFIDSITLIPLALWILATPASNEDFRLIAMISLSLPPLAFLSALALQRLAPAT